MLWNPADYSMQLIQCVSNPNLVKVLGGLVGLLDGLVDLAHGPHHRVVRLACHPAVTRPGLLTGGKNFRLLVKCMEPSFCREKKKNLEPKLLVKC